MRPDEAISMLLPLAEDADRLDRESFMLEADDRFHLALCEKAMSPALFCFLKKKMSVFRAKPFLCPALTQLAESLQPHGEPGSQAEIRGHVALFESIRPAGCAQGEKNDGGACLRQRRFGSCGTFCTAHETVTARRQEV